MSWQEYVDVQLLSTGNIQRAAIIGQAGGVWASSAGYTLSPQEQQAVLRVFTDPSAAQASGVRLAGKKFFAVQVDDQHLYGKQGAGGCTIVKTTQAVIIGEYDPPTQGPEANLVVEKLGDYLRSVGY
ncbi:profilin [Dacryopinax primogenitus]|uniref:Profilin n=1 Tax=Dacryopinax primogenitus (strain DJM 731) TaxID=1858805 RepID=M5G0Z4_DACPD|nr:profilin [Dacryopinax primogenitus]EJT99496.1 profilin [Dacryopinax primogenitus]